MQEENLNLQYNNASLIVKAINLKGNVREASKLLGMSEQYVYEMIRRTQIKILRGVKNRMYVDPKEEILYRDAEGKCICDIPKIK